MTVDHKDPFRPQAKAIPKEGYFEREQGGHGPVFPRTPACHGFTIIAKIKPGREEVIRGYAKTIEAAPAMRSYVSVIVECDRCCGSLHLIERFRKGSLQPNLLISSG